MNSADVDFEYAPVYASGNAIVTNVLGTVIFQVLLSIQICICLIVYLFHLESVQPLHSRFIAAFTFDSH